MMKKVKVLKAIILGCGLALFLASCGEKSAKTIAPNRTTEHGVPIYDYVNRVEALKEYESWKVVCLDSNECPDSVGQLIVLEGASISICTATLVDEDLILTNSHCFDLRDRVKKRYIPEDEICANGASIVFASNSASGRDSVPCGKVVKKSFLGTPGLYADYMLIKLQRKLNRKFNPVKRLGLQDKQQYSLYKVNPKTRGLGEVEARSCVIMHRTAIIPGANSDEYYMHAAKNCYAEQGNSGSALIDDQGQVRGVLFAGAVKNKDVSVMDNLQKLIHAKAVEMGVALITNATCIDYDFSFTTRFDFEACFKNMNERGSFNDLVDKTQFRRRVERRLMDVSYQLPSYLGYSLHHASGQLVAYSAPSCFQSSVMDLNNVKSKKREDSVEAPILLWQTRYAFNDRLQPVIEVDPTYYSCLIRWSPKEMSTRLQTPVQLTGSVCFDSRGNIQAQKDVWGLCQP